MNDIDKQIAIIMRGIEEILPENILEKKIQKSINNKIPLNVKLGCDPSRPDLHLGHSVVLKKLRDFQDIGHNAILVIGDFTAMIGDPTGRNKTRPQVSLEETKHNAKTYLEQAAKILDIKKLKIVYNSDWLNKLDFAKIIELNSKFTVAQFIERDDFNKRYKSGEPISLHEFMYPLAQAYDSVILRADIELGGTDQKFNLLLGRSMQKEYDLNQQLIITLPLLEGLDGKNKMSKSYDNYIAFNDSEIDMYGKTMSIPDDLIIKYFKLTTNVSLKEIKDLELMLNTQKINHRDLKRKLAREIVSLYYDDKAASIAEQHFDNVIVNKGVPDDIEETSIAQESLLIDFLLLNGLVSSKGEGKRLIKQSAIKINDKVVKDIQLVLKLDTEYVIKVGKRRFIKIV
tara:strand:+ start:12 stop:1211 length:1200 start_codon:yes stop_codon:yes gene_type:complete